MLFDGPDLNPWYHLECSQTFILPAHSFCETLKAFFASSLQPTQKQLSWQISKKRVSSWIRIVFSVLLRPQSPPDALCRSASAQQRLLPWLGLRLPGRQRPLQASVAHALWHHQPGTGLTREHKHVLPSQNGKRRRLATVAAEIRLANQSRAEGRRDNAVHLQCSDSCCAWRLQSDVGYGFIHTWIPGLNPRSAVKFRRSSSVSYQLLQ